MKVDFNMLPEGIQQSINERSILSAIAWNISQDFKYYKMLKRNNNKFPIEFLQKIKNKIIELLCNYKNQRKSFYFYTDGKTLKNDELILSIQAKL